jgi:hypothetical protein
MEGVSLVPFIVLCVRTCKVKHGHALAGHCLIYLCDRCHMGRSAYDMHLDRAMSDLKQATESTVQNKQDCIKLRTEKQKAARQSEQAAADTRGHHTKVLLSGRLCQIDEIAMVELKLEYITAAAR